MGVIRHDSPGRLDLSRGTTAICIPVYGSRDMLRGCLRTIFMHTPLEVPILVADDQSPGPNDIADIVEAALAGAPGADRQVHYYRQPTNVGFVENVNMAFAMLGAADVLIVNSDVEVGAGWFERMRAAAATDTRVATVSTLTNHGSIVSVPERNLPTSSLPADMDVDGAAQRVAAASLCLRPKIPVAIGHCVLIMRSALDLVGDFDLAFSPGYGEEVDFSLRCSERGLMHLVADDVFVLHHGGASFGGQGQRTQVQHDHDVLVNERYPYFPPWVSWMSNDERGPLGRAIATARAALVPLSVTIDARCLGETITGTQIHALELIGALHRTNRVVLRVLLPRHVGDYATEAIEALDGVEIIGEDDVLTAGRTDVVHRPYQAGHEEEIFHLAHLGRRLVVTFQDMIAYNAPSYFPSYQHYDDYLRVTHDLLASADRVIFFSPNAQLEAQRAGLALDGRSDVVLLGADHSYFLGAEPERPSRLPPLTEDGQVMLCLGTDFEHKNRVFALEVAERMITGSGWTGTLVFAGPHVRDGGSAAAEDAFLEQHPDLKPHVVDLGAVSEAEKAWLLQHADLVIYPTTVEGFGLVPIEAAEAGTPCMFAPVASLRDLFTDDLARLVPWSADESARAALELMVDGQALTRGLQSAAARLRWDDTAQQLVDTYMMAIRHPRPTSGDNAVRAILREWRIRDLRMQVDNPVGTAVDHALGAPDGLIPHEIKRATLAVASRRWLRTPIFGAIRLPYRFKSYRKRRRSDGGAGVR